MVRRLGFVLFRLFDVLKPWPIGMADKRVNGGLGIMVDDVIAGLFAAIVLQIIIGLLNYYGVALDGLASLG